MKSLGWIDIHTHLAGLHGAGVDPTSFGVAQGVGVLADAGSAPPAALPARIDALQQKTPTRVLAWANICAEGIAGEDCANHDISGAAARLALSEGAGRVVGIKLQASATRLAVRALEAIENAKAVAAESGVPLLVHVGNAPPTIREVAGWLRPGDIITHFAHGKDHGILDGARVHPAILDARARGVLFDVGHGAGSFSFAVMETLLRQGFAPDIISTDLHAGSATAPVGSLADCMSKLLGLGMPEEDVLRAVTATPRAALGLGAGERETAFTIVSESWLATDSYGATRTFERRIVPEPLDA